MSAIYIHIPFCKQACFYCDFHFSTSLKKKGELISCLIKEIEIRKDELFRGDKNAPITLIEYSDFECPYCKRGYATVNELLKKYPGKIRFAYKHLPLSFHPNAMPASQYFEALRLQKGSLAWKFHDELYENQGKLRQGVKYFKSVAKKLGANMSKLAKDVNSEAVKKRISQDLAEAKKLNIPVFALCDTNSDPSQANFAIPGNDDAFKSIEIITHAFGKAIEEGLASRKQDKEQKDREKAEEEKKAVDQAAEKQEA